MGAFWNPHGGVVLSDKKLSKAELFHVKRKWLPQFQISANPVIRFWKKLKIVVILFSPLR